MNDIFSSNKIIQYAILGSIGIGILILGLVYFWGAGPVPQPFMFTEAMAIPEIDFDFLNGWQKLEFTPFATTSAPETFGREAPFEKWENNAKPKVQNPK